MTPVFQTAAGIAVFYIFYRFFLSRDTFFQRNRIFLLGTILFSVTIPFCALFDFIPASPDISQRVFESILQPEPYDSPQNLIPDRASAGSKPVLWIYLAGCCLFFIRTLLGTLRMLHLLPSGKNGRTDPAQICDSPVRGVSFSFMNHIFIDRSVFSASDFDKILEHERVHVRQKHTLDILLAELLIIYQWFNPFAWLIGRALRDTHEFLADQCVLRNISDRIPYQLLLFRQSSVAVGRYPAHCLSGSEIRRRINMMNKNRSHIVSHTKLLFFLPVLLLFVLATENRSGNMRQNDKPVFVLPVQTGRISSAFGERLHPVSKKVMFHRGIDIAAPYGTSVYATAAGVVKQLGSEEGPGNYIFIVHDSHYASFYAQLQAILVESGQQVQPGDLIARVGSSGVSSGPHLHFEIREKEVAADPKILLDFSHLKKP